MRSLFAEPLKHAHLSDSFLFGGIPHTARVQQDHIGLLRKYRDSRDEERATCSESRSFIWQP
jgi:hypothetical protein